MPTVIPGSLAAKRIPHPSSDSHSHFLPSRPGAGSCRSDRSIESPLTGPATNPFRQWFALSLPQTVASEKNFQSSNYFSPSWAKGAWGRTPRTQAWGAAPLCAPRCSDHPWAAHPAHLVTDTDVLLVFHFTDPSEDEQALIVKIIWDSQVMAIPRNIPQCV